MSFLYPGMSRKTREGVGRGGGWGFRMGEGEGEEVCQGGGVVGGLALALAG